MKLHDAYKLTESDGTTHGRTQWGPGVRHEATGQGDKPCTDGAIHSYESPEMAALMNPIHAKFKKPILWHFAEEDEFKTDGLKRWGKAGTTTKRAQLPHFSPTQRAIWAILVTKEVYTEPAWNKWADGYLDGSNRSEAATEAAGAAAATWAARAAIRAAAAATRAATWAAGAAGAADRSSIDLTAIARRVKKEYP